ncbi:SKP1-like protein 1B [Tanacetum coccineum]
MSKPISLTSSNGESFSIDEEAAKLSLKLKTIIDQKDDLVKNISSITLSKVIEYCKAAKDLKIKGLYDLCRESLINKLAVSGNDEVLLLLNREDLKSVNETLFELADKALVKRCSSGGP